MRIKSVHFSNYKRFTDLKILGIPADTKLVVLIGPNGSGKSCVFDGFLLKVQTARTNTALTGATEGYYEKVPNSQNTHQVAKRVEVEFHGGPQSTIDWRAAFNIRSPYRNEADFTVSALQAVTSSHEKQRFNRIIDRDESVSDNYRRLGWKRMSDLDRDAPGDQTFKNYRRESLRDLQDTMKELFQHPNLLLQDFGGVQKGGTFRFAKGNVEDFHYKNLSGGEKAAFDILLDIFVKRDEYKDAIYCIDEPEAHVASNIQGPLLNAILNLIPNQSQLWISTHSIGFVRQAFQMKKGNSNNVVFLDFSGHDFDKSVVLKPSVPNRVFWKSTYKVALADLANLIAPEKVVLCEGSKNKANNGFDAKCYNRLFADEHPETLFVSQGGSHEVVNSDELVNVLEAIASGIDVVKLIDRDEMTDEKREEQIKQGIRVLSRREIEEYLYDAEVLTAFMDRENVGEKTQQVISARKSLLEETDGNWNSKHVSRKIFQSVKDITGLHNLGNTREEFALQYLVPALKHTPAVYQEISQDVFGDVS